MVNDLRDGVNRCILWSKHSAWRVACRMTMQCDAILDCVLVCDSCLVPAE